jgi:hypothetical protein
MRYNELVEAFDRPLVYKITEERPKLFSAKFKSGGSVIAFFAVGLEPAGTWDIGFGNWAPGVDMYAMTGDNTSIEVMSTVIAITRDFINRYSPETVTFTAKSSEASRVSVYRRLSQKLAGALGYSLSKEHRVPNGSIQFVIGKDFVSIDESFDTMCNIK